MVEYYTDLDTIFSALADKTRRKILKQVAYSELSVGEIVLEHKLGFAAISKHIKVLEKADLIIKRREGRKQFVSLSLHTLDMPAEYIHSVLDMRSKT